MTIERALEIIDACGADPRRWPAAERSVVLAFAADPRLVAALAAARDLDASLDDWAAADAAPMAFDVASITRQPQQGPARMQPAGAWRGWLTGGALAAAAMAGLIVLAPAPVSTISSNSPVLSATAEGYAGGSDAEAFAYVFTPTPDEDELI